MIVNPIHFNSGSNVLENDWDPTVMEEDVMLDLTGYTYVGSTYNRNNISISNPKANDVFIFVGIADKSQVTVTIDNTFYYFCIGAKAIKLKFGNLVNNVNLIQFYKTMSDYPFDLYVKRA